MNKQTQAAQVIADVINNGFLGDLLAAPGIVRVSKSERTLNVPFVNVIYSKDPSFEIHIYLFPTGIEYAIPSSKIRTEIMVLGKKFVGSEIISPLVLIANVMNHQVKKMAQG